MNFLFQILCYVLLFSRMQINEFKEIMYKVQEMRRSIVKSFLTSDDSCAKIETNTILFLQNICELLTQSNPNFQKEMTSDNNEKFSINIRDEIIGIQKDLILLNQYNWLHNNDFTKNSIYKINYLEILEHYHPVSKEKFREEFLLCVNFLRRFISSAVENRKPIFITDWDGTMKDYCSQYVTNLQPIYSALSISKFAENFTRLTAVLTAGPLRGPGILDLTALPIGEDYCPVIFSGSWGREFWKNGRRTVHDHDVTEEGIVALNRLNEEMSTLLNSSEFSQFGLVGSGMQRKVDRLTLGVQTVCGQIPKTQVDRYQEEVKERVHRVDPNKQILHVDPSELEMEVVVLNDGLTWNKGHGVSSVVEAIGDSLSFHTGVLICGDTSSDLPMLQTAQLKNPQGVMALFVNIEDKLKEKVKEIVKDSTRICFVSCPDVIHAAMFECCSQYHKCSNKK